MAGVSRAWQRAVRHAQIARGPLVTEDIRHEVRIFRLTPTVISLLDYSKGFGHTDLITC
jgi:hypothetical protein